MVGPGNFQIQTTIVAKAAPAENILAFGVANYAWRKRANEVSGCYCWDEPSPKLRVLLSWDKPPMWDNEKLIVRKSCD